MCTILSSSPSAEQKGEEEKWKGGQRGGGRKRRGRKRLERRQTMAMAWFSLEKEGASKETQTSERVESKDRRQFVQNGVVPGARLAQQGAQSIRMCASILSGRETGTHCQISHLKLQDDGFLPSLLVCLTPLSISCGGRYCFVFPFYQPLLTVQNGKPWDSFIFVCNGL